IRDRTGKGAPQDEGRSPPDPSHRQLGSRRDSRRTEIDLEKFPKEEKMATAQEQSEARFDRQSSALLIVDMQNDFCHPEGAQGIAEVLKGARQIGLPVIFVRTLHYTWTDSKTWRKRLNGYKQGIEICLPGSWGSEIIDALAPLETEPVVIKHRYSAFLDTD